MASKMAAANGPDPEEAEPFLPSDEPQSARPESFDGRRFRIIVLVFLYVFFIEAGIGMIVAPVTRIQEAIVCRQYYSTTDPSVVPASGEIPEELCKNDKVQSELALIRGLSDLFDGLVALSMAIPYGSLADRARRPVLLLLIPAATIYIGYTTVILWFSNVFPLRFIWLASFAFIVGGGPATVSAVVFTVIADVATERQRTNAFLQLGVISMAAESLATAFGAWLMGFDPWIAYFGACVVIAIGALLTLPIPETLNLFPPQTPTHPPSVYEMDELDELDERSPASVKITQTSWAARLKDSFASTRKASSFIFKDKNVLVLLLTFFVYKISRGAASFFIQYVSTRYHWTLANANYLISMRSFLNIVVFTIGLPAAAWHLVQKRSFAVREKDFFLAKISVIALLIGTVGIGLSDSIPPLLVCIIIQTCGMGFAFLIRSIITTLVEPRQVARLYVGITIIETMGALAAAPLSAALFSWGLTLGGPWLGLPHMLTGIMFALTAAGVWWVARSKSLRVAI